MASFSNVVVGSVVMALYPEDGEWYEAVVEQVDETGCVVNYIEYGNSEHVAFSQIQPIPEEVLKNGVETGGVALSPPVVEVKAAVSIEAPAPNGQQQALIASLEAQLAAETKAKNELQKQLQDEKARSEALSKQAHQSQSGSRAIADLEGKLKAAISAKEILEAQSKAQEELLQSALARTQAQKEHIQDLETQLQKAQSDRSATPTLQRSHSTDNTLKALVAELESKLANEAKTSALLAEDNQHLLAEKEACEISIQNFENQTLELELARDKLLVQLQTLDGDVKKAEARAQQAEKELAELKSQPAPAATTVDTAAITAPLIAEIATLKAELAAAKDAQSKAEDNSENYSIELDAYKQRLKSIETEYKQLKRNAAEAAAGGSSSSGGAELAAVQKELEQVKAEYNQAREHWKRFEEESKLRAEAAERDRAYLAAVQREVEAIDSLHDIGSHSSSIDETAMDKEVEQKFAQIKTSDSVLADLPAAAAGSAPAKPKASAAATSPDVSVYLARIIELEGLLQSALAKNPSTPGSATKPKESKESEEDGTPRRTGSSSSLLGKSRNLAGKISVPTQAPLGSSEKNGTLKKGAIGTASNGTLKKEPSPDKKASVNHARTRSRTLPKDLLAAALAAGPSAAGLIEVKEEPDDKNRRTSKVGAGRPSTTGTLTRERGSTLPKDEKPNLVRRGTASNDAMKKFRDGPVVAVRKPAVPTVASLAAASAASTEQGSVADRLAKARRLSASLLTPATNSARKRTSLLPGSNEPKAIGNKAAPHAEASDASHETMASPKPNHETLASPKPHAEHKVEETPTRDRRSSAQKKPTPSSSIAELMKLYADEHKDSLCGLSFKKEKEGYSFGRTKVNVLLIRGKLFVRTSDGVLLGMDDFVAKYAVLELGKLADDEKRAKTKDRLHAKKSSTLPRGFNPATIKEAMEVMEDEKAHATAASPSPAAPARISAAVRQTKPPIPRQSSAASPAPKAAGAATVASPAAAESTTPRRESTTGAARSDSPTLDLHAETDSPTSLIDGM